MNKEIPIDKTTFDTLIYFCFGFTLDENYDLIIDKVIQKAFFDATNQGAFNTLIPKDAKDKLQSIKKKCCSDLKNEIKKYKRHGKKFDEWHKFVCNDIICKYFEGINTPTEVFSYGNAQKVLNMTLKYLYMLSQVLGYENVNEELVGILREISADSRYLHIPIDRYIIDELWNSTSTLLPLKEDEHKVRDRQYAHPSEFVKSWSTWSDTDYNNTLERMDLRGEEPLEWEEKHWIEAAKNRRKKTSD